MEEDYGDVDECNHKQAEFGGNETMNFPFSPHKQGDITELLIGKTSRESPWVALCTTMEGR